MHKLEAKNLVKTIKKTKIISDISMEVRSGEVVGLLGPNGAGKTTSFYIICGLLLPSSGKVFLIIEILQGLVCIKDRSLVLDICLKNRVYLKI